jgi:hypothetical protein
MSVEYQPAEIGVRPRRSLASLLVLPLLAFIAGIAAMAWLLSRWSAGAAMLGIAQPPAQPVQPAPAPTVAVEPAAAAPQADLPPGAERLVIDPETMRRVTRVEERLAALDMQSRAAVGNADRAEGLLVAFAARRALDRGVQLGYLEGLLRQRFAQTQPQAVAAILTGARTPVTLQQLREELAAAAPALTGGGPGQSWWGAFKSEVGDLITIRREGTPSPLPEERLKRATAQLESGDVAVALAEVLRMPARDQAAKWITDARRYVAVRQALDTIETAALLEQRPAAATPAVQPQPARR